MKNITVLESCVDALLDDRILQEAKWFSEIENYSGFSPFERKIVGTLNGAEFEVVFILKNKEQDFSDATFSVNKDGDDIELEVTSDKPVMYKGKRLKITHQIDSFLPILKILTDD